MAGRKPAHLVSTARRVGGRQGIWQAIRKLHFFGLTVLADEARADRATVRTYVESLVKGGYLRIWVNAREASGQPKEYELIKDVGVEAPRVKRDGSPCTQGAAREQMWRAMKLLDSFTPRELALAASTDEHAVSDVDAADYARNLHKAAYLTLAQAATKRTQARYRFIRNRNSGPLPPQVQRLSSIWDPNLRMVVWQEEPAE